MAAEELEMGRWIRATVMHDAPLMGMVSGAYPEFIPADVSLPAVRYDFIQGTDFIVVDGVRIMTTCTFRIVVTGKGPSPSPIVAAVARMDELFRRVSVANATSVIHLLSSIRQEPFHFTEVQDQNIFTHVGGLYQLQAQEIG